MTSIFEALPFLAAYQPSLIAIAILSMAILIQGLLTAPFAFAPGDEEPGMPLKGTHADFSFRVIRTYANSVENLPVFVATCLIAIIAGVDPIWVNWLVGLHVAARILFWIVYYSGVGKVAGGPRTIGFLGGWITNAILVGMALFVLIT